MSKKPGLDPKAAQSNNLSELKTRLLFVLGAILVFRAGSFVPIPGIDAAVLADLQTDRRVLAAGRRLVEAAVAAGADALFIEVHPDPPNALSDATTQLSFDEFDRLIEQLEAMGVQLDTLTEEQVNYLNSWEEGT